jgi:integrase
MHNRKRAITLKLTRHKSGYWCKKIAGKLCYFGRRGGPESEARHELLDLIQRAEFGTSAAPVASTETISELAERYAMECEARVAAGAIQEPTWQDYDLAIRAFVAGVGEQAIAAQITPSEFSVMAGRWSVLSPARRGNYIQTIRSMFKWARLTPDYGKDFVKPSRHEYRAAAKARKRLFTTADLAAMLRYASPHQRRFLLLGLNTGMYAKDMARLRWRDLPMVGDRVYVDWLRPKTKIPQHAPLWPETVAALPPRGHDEALVFTTTSGKAIVRRRVDEPARAIHRLLRRLGLKRDGVAFGAVRHTHTSAVQDCGDRDAARLVRGHAIGGMEELYDHVDLTRLAKVTEHARQRLLVLPLNTDLDAAIVARMNARKPGRPPTSGQWKRVPGFPAIRRATDSGS